MAGYWLSSFFACLWTKTQLRSINSQKKKEVNFQHLDRTSLVNKGFIVWVLGKIFFVGHGGKSPAGKIVLSCPLG